MATLAQSEARHFRQMMVLSAIVHALLIAWMGWKGYHESASRLSLRASAPMNVMWAHTVQVPRETPSHKLPGPRVAAVPQTQTQKTPPKPKVVLSEPAKPAKSKAQIKKEQEEAQAKAREDAMKQALASLSTEVQAQPTPRPDNFPSTGVGQDDYAGDPTGGIAGMLGGNPIFAEYRARIEYVLMNNLIWLQSAPPPATVEFRMDHQGQIQDPKLVASSGNASFDSAALRAVRRSNPLPAPPAELARDIVGQWFSINFDLSKR